MAEDLYQILGVGRDASADEIKKVYRSLARKYHPDKNPEKKGAEERFKKIGAAYAVLGDEKKRKLYDQFGMDGLRDGFDPELWKRYGGGAGARAGQQGGQEFDLGGFSGFGSMEDIFESLFGSGGGRRGRRSGVSWSTGRQKGPDVRSTLEVELLDAIRGRELDIAIEVEGTLRRLKVKVPQGVEDGQVIRLAGQGAEGGSGGPKGDLLLEIRVKQDQTYHRNGKDLERRTLVTVGNAYEGGEIEVETPWGKGKLRIPAGTQGGTRFRLKGQGVRRKDQAGDLYVRVDIRVPESRDEGTREAVRELESKY